MNGNGKMKLTRIVFMSIEYGIIIAAAFIAAAFLMIFPCRAAEKESADTNVDKIYEDKTNGVVFTLKGNRIFASNNAKEIFATDEKITVSDFIIADIDKDGDNELMILCLKKGKYGNHRPSWVKEDDEEISQHIYIYDYSSDKVSAKWMASDIGVNAQKWEYFGDTLTITDYDGNKTYWTWNSWGLERAEDYVTFLVVGDNIIHTPILKYAASNSMNFDFAYEDAADYIRKPDVSIFVSETPLVREKSKYGGNLSFGTPCEVAVSLKKAGFDIAACATNHVLDRGMSGVKSTKECYGENNILSLGLGEEYVIKDINGIRFAFLNYTTLMNGTAGAVNGLTHVNYMNDEEKLRRVIRSAKKESDYVIMIVHWGTEYSSEPDTQQKELAKLFAQEGVDICIGSHPHVVQSVEVIKSGDKEMPVYYSLGNFYSAQTREGTDEGMAAYFVVGQEANEVKLLHYDNYMVKTLRENQVYRAVFAVR